MMMVHYQHRKYEVVQSMTHVVVLLNKQGWSVRKKQTLQILKGKEKGKEKM